jgi:addiction module RelE/StbE family toxin
MIVTWSLTALRQVSLIFDYLVDFNPRAAAEVASALIAAGDSLQYFPYRGRQVSGTDVREIVTAFPYIIRYRIARGEVRILRVRHTARRPTNP